MTLIDNPAERMAAATDVLLGLTAAAAVFHLRELPPGAEARRDLWFAAFALIAAAAALGAGYHGLALPEKRRRALWLGLTLALGLGISMFMAGVIHELLGAQAAHRAALGFGALGVAVFLASRFFPGVFRVFLLYEAAALVFALGAYGWLWLYGGRTGMAWMAAGAAVSLAAAAIQACRRMKLVLLQREFDHNALFHIVQTGGVALFSIGLGGLPA